MKGVFSSLLKAVLLMVLLFFSSMLLMRVGSAQVSGGTVVRVQPSETDVYVGDTFSVSVLVESVQNLYAIDVMLHWNSSMLEFQSVDLGLGVESHPNGVLHEDSGSEIYVAENNASEAEYRLVATAVSPASSFNGSGTVFSVSFKALSAGRSTLGLETELADRPPLGGIADLIEHTVVGGSVEAEENDSDEPLLMEWLFLALVVVALAVSVLGIVFFFRKRHG